MKIDIRPTWQEAVRIYMRILQDGDAEGKATARRELLRLAKLMDDIVDGYEKNIA